MPPPVPVPVPPALVIGEALIDVLAAPDGRRRAYPGGSPANVALGLARLDHPVLLATRVGRDHFGRLLRDHLGGSGVTLAAGSVVDSPTSTATARLDAQGAATYDVDIHWDLPPSVVELARSGRIAHLHTGSIAASLAPGAARVLAAVHAARPRATVSYDPNLRPALLGPPEAERPRVEELVAASDVVKASSEDLAWLYPGQDVHEVAARWARSGPSLVVLTFGGAGARALWRHGQHDLPATPVQVADTVGAGDAFMAALLSGLLQADLLGPDAAGLDAGREVAGPDAAASEAAAAGRWARGRLRAATGGSLLPAALAHALAFAGRAAALTCTRPGADPPTTAEMAALTGPEQAGRSDRQAVDRR
jgi:fructokinase